MEHQACEKLRNSEYYIIFCRIAYVYIKDLDSVGVAFHKDILTVTPAWLLNLWDFSVWASQSLLGALTESATDLETASKGLFVDSNGTHVLPLSRQSATNGFLSYVFAPHNIFTVVSGTTQQFISKNISFYLHKAHVWLFPSVFNQLRIFEPLNSITVITSSWLSLRWNRCFCCIKNPW